MFDDASWTTRWKQAGDPVRDVTRNYPENFVVWKKFGRHFSRDFFITAKKGRNVIKHGGYIKIVGFEFFTASFTDFANSSDVIRVTCGRVMISGGEGKKSKKRGEFLFSLGIKIFFLKGFRVSEK